jgi:hypothetical protein
MDRTRQAAIAQQKVRKIEDLDFKIEKEEITKEKGEEEKQKLEKEAPKRKWKLNLSRLFFIMLLVAAGVAIAKAFVRGDGLPWLFAAPGTATIGGELVYILGPLLAISVAIERLVETVFDWYEQSLRAAADVLTTPRETLDWVGQEYQNAYDAAEKVAGGGDGDDSAAFLKKLGSVEQRLVKAEQRLRSWTKSPEYIAWKRAISICAGLMAGLLVAIVGDLRMLSLIQIPVPRLLDLLVTGLVIGAGPGPMHSLIGILQSGKDAVNNLSDLARGKAIKDALETVREAAE